MDTRVMRSLLLAGALTAPLALHAQFSIEGHPVQVHGFASEGCAISNQNNFLTMKTSDGSCAMTDAGVNASIQITDKLRIGAQVYDSNVGLLNQWHP
jgi:hypothetical protein